MRRARRVSGVVGVQHLCELVSAGFGIRVTRSVGATEPASLVAISAMASTPRFGLPIGCIESVWHGLRDLPAFSAQVLAEARASTVSLRYEQHSRFFEIGRIETFGEPAVDRRKQIARLVAATPVAPKTGKA